MIEWRMEICEKGAASVVAVMRTLAMRVKASASRWMMAGWIACVSAIGLFYSKDSPAPPPPIANCNTGTPASLALVFVSPPLSVALNSHLGALSVQAFDSAGNALRDVPVTYTAPASGPSGTFNVLVDPGSDTYIPAPNPLITTVNTPANCYGATPLFIANGTLGSYQVTATSGEVSLPITIANVSPGSATSLAAYQAPQIAHINTAFQGQWWVQVGVGGAPASEVAGVPVSFAVPPFGPGGTFADGSTTATVLTDAFGRAYSPTLTANSSPGYYSVSLTSPGAPQVEAGPLINAAQTEVTLERSASSPSTATYGQRIDWVASVRFVGFPRGGAAVGAPDPGGSVAIKADGVTVASAAVNDNTYPLFACSTCGDFTLNLPIETLAIPFGTHQMTAEYQSSGAYDASSSDAIIQMVLPEFTGATATAGIQSAVGIAGGTSPGWVCTLSGAAWKSLESAATVAPPGYTIPFGLFGYRIEDCGYTGGQFTTPPAGFYPRQTLVLQFSQALPPGATFLNYGPSRDDPSPHWYQVRTTTSGDTMQVTLADSEPGDDDLTQNGVIVGLGGPAVIADQSPNSSGTFEGLWWKSPAGSESGWGMSFAQQGDVIFATWFTYDANGKGLWITMTAPKTGASTFSGALYQTSGPAFDATPFDPHQVVATAVGTGTLTFADANNGTFAYALNGISQTKSITRQVFGNLPTCYFNAFNDLSTATNFQDLWWNSPAGSESGWGISLAHESDTIFGAWFTYDHDHSPMWLAVTANKTPTGAYAGDLFRTSGPPFDAVPFDPASVQRTKVGSATLSFLDGNRASFAYTVNGLSQTKAITREVFRTPGTICR